jgi:hypothetical protein
VIPGELFAGLKPNVLREQANTLIEEIEAHSEVEFAIGIMIGDAGGAVKRARTNCTGARRMRSSGDSDCPGERQGDNGKVTESMVPVRGFEPRFDG